LRLANRPIQSKGNFERQATSEVAKLIGLTAVQALGLQPSLRHVGTHVATTECSLDYEGRSIALGLGKGLAGQEVASGIFEALEHYFYQSENLYEHATVRNLALRGDDSVLSKCSPDFGLICGDISFPLTWCDFQPLSTGHSPIQIPAFLFYPAFKSKIDAENKALKSFRFLRYSTNSGTASGLGGADTTLHALLEIIERDAVSIELLRTIIRNAPWPVRRVLRITLPGDLNFICDLSTQETGLEPVLFDITTDLRIPSILCMLHSPSGEGRAYFGSGASLSPAYAAQRAILEAVQTFHCHRYLGVPLPPTSASIGTRVSRYHRCFLSAGTFAYRGGETNISFDEIKQPIANVEELRPEEQLTYLAELLASIGYPCFERIIFNGLIQVRQVIAPGLEHFNLVSYGIPVAPGARGRGVLFEPSIQGNRPL
jgi:ribosomal protein S12 methylthiotransferase accessory factor